MKMRWNGTRDLTGSDRDPPGPSCTALIQITRGLRQKNSNVMDISPSQSGVFTLKLFFPSGAKFLHVIKCTSSKPPTRPTAGLIQRKRKVSICFILPTKRCYIKQTSNQLKQVMSTMGVLMTKRLLRRMKNRISLARTPLSVRYPKFHSVCPQMTCGARP
ncbi:hypothetical protein P692DRAFT_20517835 [Suillus brevipes Sb2]|nr:hypothetical protein P692DRAFT_20517835 [Suillus brevipes Sb2]